MPASTQTTADAIRLAFAHHLAGRPAEAEAICGAVLKQDPGHGGATHLLAVMAHAQKRLGPALELVWRAVAAAPGAAGYRNTMGIILGDLRQWSECFAAFGEAIWLDPTSFEAHRNLGLALSKAGRLDDAVAPMSRAAEIRANDPAIWMLLASLHHGRLDLPAAIECRRRALALRPGDIPAHSDLLVTLHYSPDYWAEQLFEEHLAWAKAHEEPVLRRENSQGASGRPGVATRCDTASGVGIIGPHVVKPGSATTIAVAGDRAADRPLRVGYLSGDFRDHPMPRFLLPVLRGHDRTRLEVFCYSDVRRPDAQTARLRAHADGWRDISAMDDDAAAARIRADAIDVLVDLAGHLDNRRLLVFARRPAPVQASYIGYPNTTGMRSIQYRITDAFHDPAGPAFEPADRAGSAHPLYTEQLVRLPGCCWVYDPGDSPLPPDVNDSPAVATGRVTFAVFNRLIKVTPQMAGLWSDILRLVPGSRLAALDSAGAGEASLRHSLARLGLKDAEIVVYPRGTRAEYLARYGAVDIALDTFPYTGMTTTCDAMWMGVPTVTLAGQTHVSRTGVSLLSAVGLPELIATSSRQYIDVAAGLASDLPRLAALRASLRQQVQLSPLYFGQRLAEALEEAYRRMWREWCTGLLRP
jgi:predicted O-linked N-acetylglucosamine transferase (SPINDLY family)